MAVTISAYNATARRLLDKSLTLTTLKIMLLDNNATFDATHTNLTGPAGSANVNEVANGGWTTGGETLANVAVSTVTTNDAKLDADDVTVTATGSSIGPAYAAVIYDDTLANNDPIFYIDFGQAETAGEDTDFKIVFNANGILLATI